MLILLLVKSLNLGKIVIKLPEMFLSESKEVENQGRQRMLKYL